MAEGPRSDPDHRHRAVAAGDLAAQIAVLVAVEQELAARTGQGLGGAARTLGQNSLSGAITNLTGSFGELILSMDNIEQSAGMQRFRTMLVGIASILNGSSAAGRQFQSTLRALIDGGFAESLRGGRRVVVSVDTDGAAARAGAPQK